jgi:hypothetical protein
LGVCFGWSRELFLGFIVLLERVLEREAQREFRHRRTKSSALTHVRDLLNDVSRAAHD